MTTFVMRDGALVEKQNDVPLTRSHLPAPMIISDTIDQFFSHADGKMYDSKSKYYRELKSRGLRIVEEKDGVPASGGSDLPPAVTDVGEAIQKVRAGYKPAHEPEDVI